MRSSSETGRFVSVVLASAPAGVGEVLVRSSTLGAPGEFALSDILSRCSMLDPDFERSVQYQYIIECTIMQSCAWCILTYELVD